MRWTIILTEKKNSTKTFIDNLQSYKAVCSIQMADWWVIDEWPFWHKLSEFSENRKILHTLTHTCTNTNPTHLQRLLLLYDIKYYKINSAK